MGQLICLLIFFLTLAVNSQSVVLDEFKKLQNSDGSFGSKNKALVTAVVLNTFQLSGQTPTSRLYGSTVKKAAKNLVSRVDELLKCKLDERHFFTLQALSSMYWRTGVSLLEGGAKKLFLYIVQEMKVENDWVFDRYITSDNLAIFIDAIFSYDLTAIEDERQYDLMRSLLEYNRQKKDLTNAEFFACHIIKKLWYFDKLDLSELGTPQSVSHFQTADSLSIRQLANIISALSGSSPKKQEVVYRQCLKLSTSQKLSLLNELENSAISELNIFAKTYKGKLLKNNEKNEKQISYTESPLSWVKLYHCYSFSLKNVKGKIIQKHIKLYTKEFFLEQLHWNGFTNRSVYKNLTSGENELVNAAIVHSMKGAGNTGSADWNFRNSPLICFFLDYEPFE